MRVTPRLRNVLPLKTGSMKPSSALMERVRRPTMLSKLTSAEELAPLFKVREVVVVIDDVVDVSWFCRMATM